MDQNQQNQSGTVPNNSAEFGTVRNPSEPFGNVPNGSEAFRNVRNASEGFRSVPKGSERKEDHTLTVREAARMFETAGVARTERSIINWCQLNAQGVARLDAYFDPNERKYYITPQSIERAIQEEIARATKQPDVSAPVRSVPNASETSRNGRADAEDETSRARELEKEVLDLRITNRAKDMFIERLQGEREGILNQLLSASRKVGELETKLLHLEAP